MTFNKRVTVVDEWAVTDLATGDQIRARLEVDQAPHEPERGEGMWNEGISLVREYPDYNYIDLDSHSGLEAIMDRIDCYRGTWIVIAGDYDGKDTILGTEEDMVEFVNRYLRIFWDVQYAGRFIHSGYRYSQAIWAIAEGIEENAYIPGIAESTFNEFSHWANGDVYVVVSEQRTLADAIEYDDPDIGWTEYDYPCGGYYGDEEGRYGISEVLDVPLELVPKAYEITEH